jgi:cytochrome c oxidase assembly protein subunit 15
MFARMLQPSPAFMITARPRAVARWLFAVAALIVVMVVVGGITRLTNSGLSITEWKPITGIVPPLTDAQWQAEFANYMKIPEYWTFNRDMTLAGFKSIFFWEYLHRVLGRVIGMAFALPLIWFWARKAIPVGYKPRLVALLALGGMQGAIGWWMVASGLVERTDVSHIRLTVHLLTALFILAGIVWTALDLSALERNRLSAPARLTWLGGAAVLTLFVQLMFGALTAGLDAGYAFSSWPLMGDAWFPAGTPMMSPAIANVFDNPVVVQFIHRWFAFAAAALLVWMAARTIKGGGLRAGWLVIVLVVVQIGLGIATLLSSVQIDIAVAHQANAALLLIAATACAHRLGNPLQTTKVL